MTFFDWLPDELPFDAVYYFNILIINIGLHSQYAGEVLPQGVYDIWYLDEILSPRPYAIHFFVDPSIERNIDYEFEMLPHSVLETDPMLGVSWYDMIDFYTNDPWRIDWDDEEIY